MLAWVAKIRWANEYKQAKEAQLEAKHAQIETLKELTSTRVLTEFRALKEMFDEASQMRANQLQELQKELENERLSKSELLEEIDGAASSRCNSIDASIIQLERVSGAIKSRISKAQRAERSFRVVRALQIDLFPTNEPEIKGQIAALSSVLSGLIETLIASGSLTQEQALTLLHHADLKTGFAIWDNLQGDMPDAELRRMEEQAERFLSTLRKDLNSGHSDF